MAVTQPGPTCGVTRTLTLMGQDDADALHALIYDRLDLTGQQVSDLLDEEGIDISPYVVNRHRTGRCRTCRRR